MVTVPTYTMREVQMRPDMQQGVDVRATPADFGADIGQGMQQVGQGLGQAADAFAGLRDFEDKLKSRDTLTAFQRDMMELQYGNNGFLTTQGRDAVDGREKYYADLEALKQKYGSSLNGGAAKYFDDAASTAVTSAMRDGVVHSAQGRKDWAADSSTARLAIAADQAMTVYGNPKEVNKSIAAGFLEIDAQADLMGWSSDVVQVKRQEFASGVHTKVAIALANETGGATKALDYLKTNAEMIDASARIELENKLKPYANDEAALGVVNEILGQGRTGSSGAAGGTDPNVGDMGPTNVRARLYGRAAAAGKGAEVVDGLTDSFATNLVAMFDDAPPAIRDGLQIGSGYRSDEQQAKLFAEAVKKYGSPEAARKWVAPPGGSQHNHGNAVDIWYNGQRLDQGPAEVRDWVHANAAAYGLRFPMSWEAWHIEPANARGGGAGSTAVAATDGVSTRATMASYDDAMVRVNEIQDPDVRASAMKQLNAQFEMRSKAEAAASVSAKADIWAQVAQGVPLSQIPLDLKIAAGREAVQGFMDYENKAGEITTDPTLYRDLTLLSATDPVKFAQADMTAPEIINNVSKADLKGLVDKQASALTDERKAREEGLNVTQAMGYAKTQLDAAGISQTGLKGSDAAQMAEREANFQMALIDQMRVWREQNPTKQPSQTDIMDMTNKLLLPIVIKTPGNLWDSTEDGKFSFEAGGRADGTTVDVVVEYNDIPIDLRRSIKRDLELETGGAVSEEQVITRYEEFVLSR